MGSRGPIGQSAAEKLANGNPGKRRILPDLKPVAGAPKCPKSLQGEGRAEWRRITRELERAGTLAATDRAAIEEYCRIWAQKRSAEADVDQNGMSQVDMKSGVEKLRPQVAVINRCSSLLAAYLDRFGLTPSGRGRVRIEKPVETEDEFFSE